MRLVRTGIDYYDKVFNIIDFICLVLLIVMSLAPKDTKDKVRGKCQSIATPLVFQPQTIIYRSLKFLPQREFLVPYVLCSSGYGSQYEMEFLTYGRGHNFCLSMIKAAGRHI